MTTDLGPGAVVGWLQDHASPDGLAGCAFLIGPNVVLTCAHVVGAHLGLESPVPAEPPTGKVTIRFEALQSEVTGQVLPGGWHSNIRARPGGLSDIAVVRLDEPVQAISSLPAIAQYMPAETRLVLIHGAEADYKSYGQQVQGRMSGANIARGWRQIDPESLARGFTVKNGFSGSPVLDDLGNVVWGMIVAVAEAGSGVAYAIPAEHLWTALTAAGADTTVRISDETDRRAAEAMTKVRAEYEAQLSQRNLETEQMRQELEHLRRGVRGLEQEARKAFDEGANEALDALAAGDVLPATEILRQRMEQRLRDLREARNAAAAAGRQLGTMRKLVDSADALKAFRQAAEAEPNDFWTWIEVSRLERITGTLEGAVEAITAASEAAEDDVWLSAVAYNEHGDLRRSQGDLSAALQSYQAALSKLRSLMSTDLKQQPMLAAVGWQRELSISYTKIGDVQRVQGDLSGALESYQASFAIAQHLIEDNPEDLGWQRDLSVSFNKIGDVQQAQAKLTAALKNYQASFALRQRLANRNPHNPRWQRDLSVSYERLGGAWLAQGNLRVALDNFQASLAIAMNLSLIDPGNAEWQRDLLVAYSRIGDVQWAQGTLNDALNSFHASLAIMNRLAQADLDNASWQHELCVLHDKIGDVLRMQGALLEAFENHQTSFNIAKRLVQIDSRNADWQRDLSVSHEKIGDLHLAQGRFDEALENLKTSLAIMDRLTRMDPGNAEWQRDLAASYEKIGDLHQAQGKGEEAVASFIQALEVYQKAQMLNPGDVQMRLSSVVPLWRLGVLQGTEGQANLEAALRILQQYALDDQLDHVHRAWIAQIEVDLAGATSQSLETCGSN